MGLFFGWQVSWLCDPGEESSSWPSWPLDAARGVGDFFSMNQGFYVFRFKLPLDRDKVLLEGSWVLDDIVMAIGPWTLSFQPSLESLRAVIWLCLPDLPPAFRTTEALELIVGQVGRLVKLDQPTELFSNAMFARVTVEVDLSRPLVPRANIDVKSEKIPNFWQIFEYEHC